MYSYTDIFTVTCTLQTCIIGDGAQYTHSPGVPNTGCTDYVCLILLESHFSEGLGN